MEDNSLDNLNINELTEKLKFELSGIKDSESQLKQEKEVLKKENLENFILEKTGELVNEGLETIRDLKGVFVSNPDAEEIEALSQAFKAVSSALSVLKDLQVTSMKNNNNKEIKEMDIKAKKELKLEEISDNTQKIYLTRDEIFKKLLEKTENVVDVEFEKEIKQD